MSFNGIAQTQFTNWFIVYTNYETEVIWLSYDAGEWIDWDWEVITSLINKTERQKSCAIQTTVFKPDKLILFGTPLTIPCMIDFVFLSALPFFFLRLLQLFAFAEFKYLKESN